MTTGERIDYLAQAAPHGTTFPRLHSAADRARYALSDEQVARYREEGFLHDVPILEQAQIAALRQGLEDIVQGRNGREDELIGRDMSQGEKLTYLQGGWIIDETLHDLVFHPAITVKLAQLLDTPRVRFWHDQVFYKPPRTGGNVAWHQDYSYWQRSTPSQHITVWIGLDDATTENGCLHVIPGSHRWGLLKPDDLFGDMDQLRQQLDAEKAAAFKPFPCEQPVGHCSFHHDHTVHGSFRNESDRPRRAVILNYMADGTRSAADDGVLMPGFPPVSAGEVISGKAFPLVIDLQAVDQ